MMSIERTVVVWCLLVGCAVKAVPVFELAKPFWDNVCGQTVELEPIEDAVALVSWHEQLGRSVSKLRYLLRNARDLLDYQNFDKLYVQVRRGVKDRQYIPNWVPSRGDVEALLAVETFTVNEFAKYLPVLLKDLQKFAVAFEQVYKDEYESIELSPREEALVELIGTLRQLLCEVESTLWSLDMSYGPSVSRSLMSPEERDIGDFTHRMVRDNGILVKYRDFLAGWNELIALKQLAAEFKK